MNAEEFRSWRADLLAKPKADQEAILDRLVKSDDDLWSYARARIMAEQNRGAVGFLRPLPVGLTELRAFVLDYFDPSIRSRIGDWWDA